MFISNITNDFDNITSSNYTKITDANKCTLKENNFDVSISTLY